MNHALAPLVWLAHHPVARQRPLRTWWRWLYWQVRQRFTTSPKIIPFLSGARLAVYPREGLTGYWYLELPEYEEMVFLQRCLRRGDSFLDVGANAGAFAVLAASLGCQVTAFEPIPQTFARLRENAELNSRFGPILVLNQAVGATAGWLRMTTGLGTGNHILKPGENAPSVEVAVVPLDTAIPSLDKPTFIKIDVEGHEWEVIQGATELLGSPRLLGLLIETFRPHNWQLPRLQSLEARLREHGFVPFDYDVETNALRALSNPQDGGYNTFYVRDLEVIERRLH